MFAYMRRDSEILRLPTIARPVVLALLQILGLVIREEVLKKMFDVWLPHMSQDHAAKLREIDAKSRVEYTTRVTAYNSFSEQPKGPRFTWDFHENLDRVLVKSQE